MLAPFAPHLGEEIWESLGNPPSIEDARWPEHDAELIVLDSVEVAIQVNGKLRDTVRVARDAEDETVREAALSREKIQAHVKGKTIRKTFHVKNRLVNLIVG
jgi:leucyl-tRNA synthetase